MKSFQLHLDCLPRPLVLQASGEEDLATTDKVQNFLHPDCHQQPEEQIQESGVAVGMK
jgi:hypothetical protein